jgi:hypothetical protein
VAGLWSSPCPPVSSTNKTDHHDIVSSYFIPPSSHVGIFLYIVVLVCRWTLILVGWLILWCSIENYNKGPCTGVVFCYIDTLMIA